MKTLNLRAAVVVITFACVPPAHSAEVMSSTSPAKINAADSGVGSSTITIPAASSKNLKRQSRGHSNASGFANPLKGNDAGQSNKGSSDHVPGTTGTSGQ